MTSYGSAPQLSKKPFRQPAKGEVVIKVMCTTIHPADAFFMLGVYGHKQPKKLPVVPGIEGSGEIIAIGEGVNKNLIGIRCGFSGNCAIEETYEGVWSLIFYADVNTILPFNKTIDFEKIAFSFINPVTACGFIDTIQGRKETAAAQNAANSSVGKIFINLCKYYGIKSVNLVRKKEQIEELKKLGADFVFSTSEPNWKNFLKPVKI